MMSRPVGLSQTRILLTLSMAWLVSVSPSHAQDRLKTMPGYPRFEARGREIADSVKSGTLSVRWLDGGKAFEYRKADKNYRYDLATHKAEEAKPGTPEPPAGGRRPIRGGGAGRGRQLDSVASPDGTLKAVYRDRNLYVTDPNGLIEMALTTDGSEKDRIKNGKASWVYGEELSQNTAFWWSPDSKKVAYYRFDESKVIDYFLQVDQTKVQDRLYTEPYPKAGSPNPTVELFVYDLKAKKATKVDVREGRAVDDENLGYYVYNISWSNDGKLLLFHRTNRHQNILEMVAADPETGKSRVVARDEWASGWIVNNPETRFLEDGQRFLRAVIGSGYKNYELYHLDGRKLAVVTANEFDADRIVRVDEKGGFLDYTAHDGDNPMKIQLHRVKLDGKEDRRLTDPAFHHTVNVAPDGEHFIDVIQTHDTPASTRLVDASGKVIETLLESDLAKFNELGLKRVELIKFKAADGQTDLYGMLHKPSDFDPSKKYPMIVSVYAGPETNGARETFTTPNSLTELGFLVAAFDSRSAGGRGKKFVDAIYLKLGVVEIDDQAAGVRSLRDRSYVDPERVGIFGTSYGGYASIQALLRHPDAFQAACGSSSVTDYRHYDTIYTERYMRTPQENKAGYDGGSAVTHAADLKGRLMIYYGTADDNVHPSNSLQLIQALQRAGKSFEVQVGPDAGHSGINRERMMEFFIESLAAKPSLAGISPQPRAVNNLRERSDHHVGPLPFSFSVPRPPPGFWPGLSDRPGAGPVLASTG